MRRTPALDGKHVSLLRCRNASCAKRKAHGMKRLVIGGMFAAMALAMSATFAQVPQPDIGKREFESSCAICHGLNGKGGGSLLPDLQISAPGLTTLSKSNGGVFPAAHLFDIIDGRADIKAHGARDMPIWGQYLRFRAAPQYDDYPWDGEAFARARIVMVIEYVQRLQEK
jgi:mono/diheme cytochrome c family protein